MSKTRIAINTNVLSKIILMSLLIFAVILLLTFDFDNKTADVKVAAIVGVFCLITGLISASPFTKKINFAMLSFIFVGLSWVQLLLIGPEEGRLILIIPGLAIMAALVSLIANGSKARETIAFFGLALGLVSLFMIGLGVSFSRAF